MLPGFQHRSARRSITLRASFSITKHCTTSHRYLALAATEADSVIRQRAKNSLHHAVERLRGIYSRQHGTRQLTAGPHQEQLDPSSRGTAKDPEGGDGRDGDGAVADADEANKPGSGAGRSDPQVAPRAHKPLAQRLMPEYSLPYAIHILAHHPDFPTDDDDEDNDEVDGDGDGEGKRQDAGSDDSDDNGGDGEGGARSRGTKRKPPRGNGRQGSAKDRDKHHDPRLKNLMKCLNMLLDPISFQHGSEADNLAFLMQMVQVRSAACLFRCPHGRQFPDRAG